jgi:hypothetical protein
MSELNYGLKIVSGALAGGIGIAMLSGCSTVPGTAENALPQCTSVGNDTLALPPQFNVDLAASDLNVDRSQIINGNGGKATCDNPIKVSDVNKDYMRINVDTSGDQCLAIGFQQDPSLYPEQKSIIAICAAAGRP